MQEARLHAAKNLLDSIAADAILILGLTNIRYLTGFSGSDGALLLSREGQWLLCDSRYTTQANQQAPLCRIVEYKIKSEAVSGLVIEQGWRRLAFDAEQTTVSVYGAIAATLTGV